MNFSSKVVKFSVLGIFLFVGIGAATLLQARDKANRGTTTRPLEEEEKGLICIGEDLARIVSPDNVRKPPPLKKHARTLPKEGENWVLRDSIKAQVDIPAGESHIIYFDHRTDSLEEIPWEDGLSDAARFALQKAPRWLYDDLKDSFLLLGNLQDTYANLILNAQDPYIDEVAFQVAHIAPETLSDPQVFLYLHMLVENAELMYEIDQYLDYVDIVDSTQYGDSTDYFSTTRYRVISDGDTTWVTSPKEYYYWYILHPKISDEDVKMTDEPSDRQATYGYFWREYLFFDPPTEHSYTEGGYPLLKDCLDSIRVFWDGQQHDLPFGRPFEKEDMALDVIGNWTSQIVPVMASGNRPIQPNQIACEHNGNCGELQDLLCAAARTALIPSLCTMDICEDHVWGEFYWDGDWHPYQVDRGGGGTHIDNPGVSYDVDRGGSKQVSAIWDWRPDGYSWTVTGRYSDSCFLVTTVHDFNGNPVDGARVRLYAEPIWGGDFYVTTWGYTNSDGRCEFELGDHRDFYARVESPLGNYPAQSGTIVKIIDMSVGGQTYFKPFTVPEVMDGFQADEADWPEDPLERYKVEIRLDVPQETEYGMNLYDGNTFAQKVSPGRVDFFICDSANYAQYTVGEPFGAYEITQDLASMDLTFKFPTDANWYMVFSSEYLVTNREKVTVRVDLYENLKGVEQPQTALSTPKTYSLSQNYPNPFNPTTAISYQLSGVRPHRTTLKIYNARGQLVRTLVNGEKDAGSYTVRWDGRDEMGKAVASGVYLYKLTAGGFNESKKMALLR